RYPPPVGHDPPPTVMYTLSLHDALPIYSGLEVDALDGAPGVRSARFAGSPCDDDANNALLLGRMRGVPAGERSARYRCVIAIALDRKSTRLNSSHVKISYAVFCLKKKNG